MGEDSAVLGRLLSDHTVLNKGTEDELVGGNRQIVSYISTESGHGFLSQ